MNRREAITGTLAAGAAMSLGLQAQPEPVAHGFIRSLWTDERYAGQKSISTTALVNDPDVQEISISVLLRKGKEVKGLDSCVLERALLKHVGDNTFYWFKHCRDTGMKTL